MLSDFAYLSCLSIFGGVVVFPRRILKVKCQWEETFGNFTDRLAVSRSTVMKTEITASDLFINPVHIVDMERRFMFATSLAALMYVLA